MRASLCIALLVSSCLLGAVVSDDNTTASGDNITATTHVDETTAAASNDSTTAVETTAGVDNSTTVVETTAAGAENTTAVDTTAGVDNATTAVDTTAEGTDGTDGTTTTVGNDTTTVDDTTTGVDDTATAVDSSTAGVEDTMTGVNDTATNVDDVKRGEEGTTTVVGDAAADVKVQGSFELTVANVTEFVESETVKAGLQNAIATSAGVANNSVAVTMEAARRLSASNLRQLSGAVKVDYTVLVPAGSSKTPDAVQQSLTAATSDKATFAAALVEAIKAADTDGEFSGLSITVASVKTPSQVKVTATTTAKKGNADTGSSIRSVVSVSVMVAALAVGFLTM